MAGMMVRDASRVLTRAERHAKKRAQALADLDRPAHPRAWPAGSYDDVDELGCA